MDEAIILDRGVSNIYPNRGSLLKILRSGKKLTIYNGIDPSGSLLHLGHAVVLQKLAQFQKLGHKIIILVGDFTGRIGDPTGKSTARVALSEEQVLQNAKEYQSQASKILNFSGNNPAELRYNSTWLSKLTLEDVVKLASNFTIQQMIERDMFQERIRAKKPIYVHEFLYPLMQGYDSVAMAIDMEIGGSDQTFNMLVGRSLAKTYLNKEKLVLTTPLLKGLDGNKMGKSEGNFIALTESANAMFKKIMELPDELLSEYFYLTTDLPDNKIKKILDDVGNKQINPQQAKTLLATAIVTKYHGQTEAQNAQAQYQQGTLKTSEIVVKKPKSYITKLTIAQLVFEIGLAKSITEAKQIISQHGLKVNGQIITNPQEHINPETEIILTRANNQQVTIRTNG